MQIIQTPPKGLVQRESMLIRVPKIRAHNLEDISCSTLMVIGESVSSDCCLKDECLQCLSVHFKSGNIFFIFSDLEVLLLTDTLHDIPHQSAQNTTRRGDSRRNPELRSCDSIKVTLLEKKNKINKCFHLRLRCAVKSFVTASW